MFVRSCYWKFILAERYLLCRFVHFSVIGTVKTNRTQSRGSVVVCPIPRSVSSTWVRRRRRLMTSRFAYTWCLTSMNSWARRRWRRAVSAATNTLWRTAARISSISACGCILSTSSASIKCYRALELIGMYIKTCILYGIDVLWITTYLITVTTK